MVIIFNLRIKRVERCHIHKNVNLLVQIEQTDTNHNYDETNSFEPGKFIVEVKYCNLKVQ